MTSPRYVLIKVRPETRDKLRLVANVTRRTMGQTVAVLVDRAMRQMPYGYPEKTDYPDPTLFEKTLEKGG